MLDVYVRMRSIWDETLARRTVTKPFTSLEMALNYESSARGRTVKQACTRVSRFILCRQCHTTNHHHDNTDIFSSDGYILSV